MERVTGSAFDGAQRCYKRLSDHLATKHPGWSQRLWYTSKQICLDLFEIKMFQYRINKHHVVAIRK
jgi:hypothetical protein